MDNFVNLKDYGKVEGTVVEINKSNFFNMPSLNQYYNEIYIEKEVDGKKIKTMIRKREYESCNIHVGDYISFC